MSTRVSQYVLLCEDEMQRRLVRAYLRRCGVSDRIIKEVNPSQDDTAGISWVIKQFAQQLEACRHRQQVAKTLLIVVIDADKFSIEERKQHLYAQCNYDQNDPLIVLVPKRHIETWVAAGTGQAVKEEEDCKSHSLAVRQAAQQIHDWARNELPPVSTCIPSLRVALPDWRRIG